MCLKLINYSCKHPYAVSTAVDVTSPGPEHRKLKSTWFIVPMMDQSGSVTVLT